LGKRPDIDQNAVTQVVMGNLSAGSRLIWRFHLAGN
jgi:hypothetical protein